MSYEICCFFATDGKLANWQNLPEKIFTILFESVQNVHTGILCHLVERGDGYALSVAFQAVGKLFVASQIQNKSKISPKHFAYKKNNITFALHLTKDGFQISFCLPIWLSW